MSNVRGVGTTPLTMLATRATIGSLGDAPLHDAYGTTRRKRLPQHHPTAPTLGFTLSGSSPLPHPLAVFTDCPRRPQCSARAFKRTTSSTATPHISPNAVEARMFCAVFAFGQRRRRLCLLYPRSSSKYKFTKPVGAYSHGVAHRACGL
jgi:hypothetical protein